MRPHDYTARVLRNVDHGDGNFLIEFEAGPVQRMEPAQFFMIGIPGAETLLRRPYSVCGLPGTFEDATPGAYSVLYKVVGKGTRLLATLAPGAQLSVLGPLGHGFGPLRPGERPIFVAGGIGSAPFPALAHALRGNGVHMFYGARTAGDLPLADWFADQVDELVLSTDDGSRGEHGRVTVPLERALAERGGAPWRLYACGPDPMLHAVSQLAQRYGVACELAMEAHMACGFGVCLGCVVPTHGTDGIEYRRLCVDGPVVAAEEIAW